MPRPCPYPTQPGWTQPWHSTRQQSPQQPYRNSNSQNRNPDTPQASTATSFNALEPTDIGAAFQAVTLDPPEDSDWYMDTGASSHLTADSGKLQNFHTNNHIKSIFVGNGHAIPVMGTGNTNLLCKPKPISL
ncbi:hypothetical protein LXL04_020023 [Taraxacum kok-saghyz]